MVEFRHWHADISADELANDALPSGEEQTKTDAACDWLYDKFAGGTQASQDLYDEAAKKNSFSASTLKRASRRLGVLSTREGYPSRTRWALPPGQTIQVKYRN